MIAFVLGAEDGLPTWSPTPTAAELKREEMVERMKDLIRRQDVISPTTSATAGTLPTGTTETEKPRVNGKGDKLAN